MASRCSCNALAVTMLVTGPSTACAIAFALAVPLATSTSWRALRIVPTPIVMAYTGTSSRRSKKRALSSMVCLDSVLSRVRELSELVGSLKAMCPSVPIPRICKSIPPVSPMRRSYHSQKAA
jgi:hypothetical protein